MNDNVKYLILNKKGSIVRQYNDAEGIKVFMWGKNFRHYSIYIRCDGLPTEINDLEVELKRLERQTREGV